MNDLTTSSDKLTALPESLLHLILSFLDIKRVVQTSCLSKKWRNIWRSVPVLNFNFFSLMKVNEIQNPSHRKECMDIVDRILFCHDDSSIQKISLFYFFNYDIGQVDAWLLFVVEQQVKEVQLRIRPSEDYHQLPHLLFTSVIEKFEISTLSSRFLVQLPNSMCSARQLRILKLEEIILPKGDSNGELVISCPILEEMFLKRCSHHNLKILSICAPQLNNLEIYNCHTGSCKIKICTPNLTLLKLILSCYKDYFLESLSFLVTAYIEVSHLSTMFLMTILNGIHNVETLVITDYGYKGWCSIEDKEEDWGEVLSMQTMFSHLKYIRVRTFNGRENEVKLLEYLLKTAPGLLTMRITSSKAFSKSKKIEEITEKLHSLPRAASSAIIMIT